MPQALSVTGIVADDRYLRHDTGAYHPESSRRLESIYQMLESDDMKGSFFRLEPRRASCDEIALIHHPAYIDRVAATAGQGSILLDPDTVASPESYETALLAAGGLLTAVDAVMTGKVKNAFALVRPPGHHAEAHRSGGFCIFNNAAIAAAYAKSVHRLERILIVDWDLHHGNGTQRSFYDDPGVLYFSTHQYPMYPGTGSIEDTGRGAGTGYTINVPLSSGQGDMEYLSIFRKILEPVACAYNPQLLILSAGFDICEKDLLGGMKVTPPGFVNLIRVLLDIADRCCYGRLVATLEGGYNIRIMTRSLKAVLREMSGSTRTAPICIEELERCAGALARKKIAKVIDCIHPFWKVFEF